MRIIDRDFGFYESMVDEHVRALIHCAPADEVRHVELRDAAATVRDALALYRGLIDAPQEKY